MPVSAMAPRPLRRLSLLVLGVEDAFGLATIRQLEADGHQVIAAHVEGRRSGTDLGLPARGPSGGDGAGLSPGTQPCDAMVFLAPLAADACSAAAYHLTASRRARHGTSIDQVLGYAGLAAATLLGLRVVAAVGRHRK